MIKSKQLLFILIASLTLQSGLQAYSYSNFIAAISNKVNNGLTVSRGYKIGFGVLLICSIGLIGKYFLERYDQMVIERLELNKQSLINKVQEIRAIVCNKDFLKDPLLLTAHEAELRTINDAYCAYESRYKTGATAQSIYLGCDNLAIDLATYNERAQQLKNTDNKEEKEEILSFLHELIEQMQELCDNKILSLFNNGDLNLNQTLKSSNLTKS